MPRNSGCSSRSRDKFPNSDWKGSEAESVSSFPKTSGSSSSIKDLRCKVPRTRSGATVSCISPSASHFENMETKMTHQRMVIGLILFTYLAQLCGMPAALANPTGPTVVGGQAAVAGLGTAHVTITQASQRAIINWQQFNIAPNEVTQFVQPNVRAQATTRIFDPNTRQ